jgi:GT2 family glycosyltransferase
MGSEVGTVKISTVIPAFNAGKELRILLFCLNHSRLDPSDSLEVIVVDDGSTDGTGDMVASFPAKFDLRYTFLPRTERSSRAAARNAGIAAAEGELLIMADADQIVTPTYVEEHVRYHRLRHDLVVVAPRADLRDGRLDEEVLAEQFSFEALPPIEWGDPRELVLREFSVNFNQLSTCWHHMFTCNVSVRRRHVLAVGGFDEAYIGWGLEDSDLGYRLRGRGLAFAYNAAAMSYHQKAHDVDANMYAQWRRNLSYMISKYESPEVAAQAVIVPSMDPSGQSYDWTEAMRRFEFAVRALAGRLPRPTTYELIEVDVPEVETVLEQLDERTANADVLVMDNTPGAHLSGPTQCVDTHRELLYFHRPSMQEKQDIYRRYTIAR